MRKLAADNACYSMCAHNSTQFAEKTPRYMTVFRVKLKVYTTVRRRGGRPLYDPGSEIRVGGSWRISKVHEMENETKPRRYRPGYMPSKCFRRYLVGGYFNIMPNANNTSVYTNSVFFSYVVGFRKQRIQKARAACAWFLLVRQHRSGLYPSSLVEKRRKKELGQLSTDTYVSYIPYALHVSL